MRPYMDTAVTSVQRVADNLVLLAGRVRQDVLALHWLATGQRRGPDVIDANA